MSLINGLSFSKREDFFMPGLFSGGGGVAAGTSTNGLTVPAPMSGSFYGVPIKSYDAPTLTAYLNINCAAPIQFHQDVTIDGFVFLPGSTAWSGRTIGLYEYDPTALALGAEVVSVSSVAGSASTQTVAAVSDTSLTANTVYWLAFGGGTGSTKAVRSGAATDEDVSAGLFNTLGCITIDSNPTSATQTLFEQSFLVSSVAASGTFSTHADPADARARPLIGVRIA